MATKREQRSPVALDQLRAQALRGDGLEHESDSTREWVWRSLLKGVRRDQAVKLAGLTPAQVERALARIERLYQQRVDVYKAAHPERQRRPLPVPRVVRPVAPPPPRRGWRLFGKRR